MPPIFLEVSLKPRYLKVAAKVEAKTLAVQRARTQLRNRAAVALSSIAFVAPKRNLESVLLHPHARVPERSSPGWTRRQSRASVGRLSPARSGATGFLEGGSNPAANAPAKASRRVQRPAKRQAAGTGNPHSIVSLASAQPSPRRAFCFYPFGERLPRVRAASYLGIPGAGQNSGHAVRARAAAPARQRIQGLPARRPASSGQPPAACQPAIRRVQTPGLDSQG